MGLFLRPAKSSEPASSQASGKGAAFRALSFLFVHLLVGGIRGSGRRFEEEGEREASGIVVVPDAAVVETGDGGAAAEGDVEGGGEAVILCIAGGGGGRGLLSATRRGGVGWKGYG